MFIVAQNLTLQPVNGSETQRATSAEPIKKINIQQSKKKKKLHFSDLILFIVSVSSKTPSADTSVSATFPVSPSVKILRKLFHI